MGSAQKRILVIEDNRTNRELAAYLLKAYGFTVLTAENGEQGLAEAKRSRPDLIVCDIHMPRMDGFAIANRLKSDRDLQHIPLVAMTALAMVGDRDRIMASRFDGYLSKPIEPEKFAAQIAVHLDMAALPQPVRRETNGAQAKPTPAEPPAPAPKTGSTPVIVVIDDSGTNLDLFCRSLAAERYEIVPCMNADDALGLVRKHMPDLIVCDIHMPRRDGFALLTAIKADRELRKIPFALISSTAWPERDREIGMQLGAAKFISRPIDPWDLAAEVATCLGIRRN